MGVRNGVIISGKQAARLQRVGDADGGGGYDISLRGAPGAAVPAPLPERLQGVPSVQRAYKDTWAQMQAVYYTPGQPGQGGGGGR